MRKLDVVLPGGARGAEEEVIRDFTVREITGEAEEALHSSKNAGRLMTLIVCKIVERNGALVSMNSARQMYTGDRMFLFLNTKVAAEDSVFDAIAKCRSCEKENVIPIDVKSLELKTLPDDFPGRFEVELEDGVEVGEDKVKKIWMRLSIGEDDELTAPVYEENFAKGVSAMLQRCAVDVGGEKPPAEFALKLTLKDRRKIMDTMYDTMPGYNLVMTHVCEKCGMPFEAVLGLENFLYPVR